MAKTKETISHTGLFQKMREFYVERTALFGIIKWREMVRIEKIENDLILVIETTQIPTQTFVNGKEYRLLEVINN